MVCTEAYPCYVRVCESGIKDIVELPTETDGTMLLSTITAQFPDAIGLRFKAETGAWRGVRVTNGVLDVPLEGWGNMDYIITKTGKRKAEDDDVGPKSKKEMLQDLIVLGLPYSSTEDDLKEYFATFGELAHWEVKTDRKTNESKGYGFVRFIDPDVVERVLAANHTIGGRKCEVQFPRREQQQSSFGVQDGVPTKLFIGRLPRGATTNDLRDTFFEYGPLKDVYIPNNFRGFGFVTFPSQYAADAAMNTTHSLKGNTLNLTHPSPKAGEQKMPMQPQQQQYGYVSMPIYGSIQGNMQGGQNMISRQSSIQGNMQGMWPQQMQPLQQGSWYGSQPAALNNGYYTKGYMPSSSKQGGKGV